MERINVENYETDELIEELEAQKEELMTAVDELNNQNEYLAKTAKELETRNYELDQIIYRTDHDLKSPITSIQGISYLLRDQLKSDDLLEYVDLIDHNVKSLKQLIKSMVSFAQNIRTDLEISPIDFEDILKRVKSELESIQGFSEVRISTKMGDDVQFEGDQNRIYALFYAFVSNCIVFRDIDKKKNWAIISIESQSNGVVISISDNGIGMNEDISKKAFEMFYRGSEQSIGSGLGLYLTKTIIEQLKGTISIQSKEGTGTSIRLFIPSSENK